MAEALAVATVGSVLLVRRYPKEDLRRRAFEIEDALKGYLDGTVAFAPDEAISPAASIKFSVSDGKRSFLATGLSIQMQLSFEGGLPKSGVIDPIASAAKRLDAIADGILKHQERAYSGIVVQYSAAFQGDRVEVYRAVANATLKVPIPSTPAAVDVNLGGRFGDINRLAAISTYAVYSTQVFGALTAPIQMDADFDKATEEGLQLKLDVNTRPRSWQPKDFMTLVGELKALHASSLVDPYRAFFRGAL